MPEFEETQAAVTAYLRAWIDALNAQKVSYDKIGKRVGVSKGEVMAIAKPDRYGARKVGPKLMHNAAAVLHSGSIDALCSAALAWTKGVRIVVPDGAGGTVELVRPERPPSVPPAAAEPGAR